MQIVNINVCVFQEARTPEELDEERVHKMQMKEQMKVVRGMVSRKPRGGAAAAATPKLAPKPEMEVPPLSGAVMIRSSPPPPSTPMTPASAANVPPGSVPTTMPGYLCINVPIFVPSSSKSSTTETSTTAGILPAPTILPMMPQSSTPGASVAAPVPILPNLPGAASAPMPPGMTINLGVPPGGPGQHAGAVTMPVNSTNTPIVASSPGDSAHAPASDQVPPLVRPQEEEEDEDLEPGEIRRPAPPVYLGGAANPVVNLQPMSQPSMPVPVQPRMEGQASIAIKCEDGQVRFFPIQGPGVPPPPPMPHLMPVKAEPQDSTTQDDIPTPPGVVEVRPTDENEDGVLNLVMRRDEDGTEEWRNSSYPQDLSTKQYRPPHDLNRIYYPLLGLSSEAQTPEGSEVIDLSVKTVMPSGGDSSHPTPGNTPPMVDGQPKGRKRGLDGLVAKLWQTKIKRSEHDSPLVSNRSTPASSPPIVDHTPAVGLPTLAVLPIQHDIYQPAANSAQDDIEGYPSPIKPSHNQDFCMNKFHTCKICKQLFEKAEDMWEHALQHDESHNSRCNVCDYKAPSITDMVKHNYQEHGEMFPPTPTPLEGNLPQVETKNEDYYCSVCGKGFSDPTELREHVLQHNEDESMEFICEYDRCKLKFTTNRDLWYHIEKAHLKKSNPKRYACPAKDCDRRFASLNHLKRHMVAHSNTRPIACAFPGCDKTFKEVQNLSKHQSKHMGQAPCRCVLCGFACEDPSGMSIHMKESHWMDAQVMLGASIMDGVLEEEEPPLTDEHNASDGQKSAERKSTERENGKKNMNGENGKNTDCTVKAGSDARSGYFTTVMKIKYNTSGQATLTEEKSSYHPQETKFHVCKICKQLFETAQKMWSHRLVEHDELNKIYCELCSFNTESRLELETHAMTVHHQELPDTKEYMCCWCGKVFSSRHGFRHHVLKHSEDGPPEYPCPQDNCDEKFLSRLAIKLHMHQAHPKPAQDTPPDTTVPSADGDDNSQGSNLSSNEHLVCDYKGCDKSFREAKHLKVHKMLHTDEKPLKCAQCDYSCRQRNSMNWHMKSKHNMQKQVTPDGRTIYV